MQWVGGAGGGRIGICVGSEGSIRICTGGRGRRGRGEGVVVFEGGHLRSRLGIVSGDGRRRRLGDLVVGKVV